MHIDAEFKIIFDRNTEYKNQTSDILIARQTRSIFFPVLFYFEVTSELSGEGVQSFKEFFEYCIKKKKEFVWFYVLTRHASRGNPIIKSFIKGDENIFRAKPRLPKQFEWGVVVSLLWLAGLLVIGYRAHLRFLFRETTATHTIDTKGINPVFIRCRDEVLRDEISRYYDLQPGSCSLDKINTDSALRISFTPLKKTRFQQRAEVALYRITIELINNTIKYAK